MPAFLRVDASLAGTTALGILVPPGDVTLVIVRPRPLHWDLLAARWNGDSASSPTFCQFAREDAAGIARRLQRTLEQRVAEGCCPLETFGDGRHFQIWLRTDEFFWIVCRRAPGQTYQPALFASLEEAENAANELTQFLWPPHDAQQEYYFNTQQFK